MRREPAGVFGAEPQSAGIEARPACADSASVAQSALRGDPVLRTFKGPVRVGFRDNRRRWSIPRAIRSICI